MLLSRFVNLLQSQVTSLLCIWKIFRATRHILKVSVTCELRPEEYAFVLLSRFVNLLQAQACGYILLSWLRQLSCCCPQAEATTGSATAMGLIAPHADSSAGQACRCNLTCGMRTGSGKNSGSRRRQSLGTPTGRSRTAPCQTQLSLLQAQRGTIASVNLL